MPLVAVPSVLGISVVLFTVLALAPGDPFGELATNPNVPPEVQAALREKFGLNDPVLVRYWRWLVAMLHGDWGFSFISRVDVDTLMLDLLPGDQFLSAALAEKPDLLDEALREGRVQPGNRIILAAFGAGVLVVVGSPAPSGPASCAVKKLSLPSMLST